MQTNFALWNTAGGGAAVLYAELDSTYSVTYTYDGFINPRTIISDYITCTPHNGTPPYTYSWVAVSNPDGISISASAASGTTFTKSLAQGAGPVIGTFKCTVTDAAATVVDSPVVTIELEHGSLD